MKRPRVPSFRAKRNQTRMGPRRDGSRARSLPGTACAGRFMWGGRRIGYDTDAMEILCIGGAGSSPVRPLAWHSTCTVLVRGGNDGRPLRLEPARRDAGKH